MCWSVPPPRFCCRDFCLLSYGLDLQPYPLPNPAGSVHCIVEKKMFENSSLQKQPLHFISLGFILLWMRMQACIFLLAALHRLHGHRKEGRTASALPCSARAGPANVPVFRRAGGPGGCHRTLARPMSCPSAS